MSDDTPIHYCYKRDREHIGSAQSGNDELLRMIADCQCLERSDGDLGYGADIRACFTSDLYPVRHILNFFS